MTAAEPLKQILIVGGGTAGWLAAAYLNRLLRPGCQVTLVESVLGGTAGVAEASTPRLAKLVRELRLDETTFLRRCYATYQVGFRFDSWHHDRSDAWHPFGLSGAINGIDLFHYWLRAARAERDAGAYSDFSVQALLGQLNKAPRPINGPSPVIDSGAYAYHYEPYSFADLLKEVATTEGVRHHFDDVLDVVLDGRGWIEQLVTAGRRSLSADLYLDCSGPDGRLIGQALGDAWLSWSHHLLCDRIVALPLPREERMPPYTRATALSAGWMAQVPLSHRTGCSYVYSSAHTSEEAAVRELVARGSPNRACPAEPRHTTLRAGRRQNAWVRNCIALGPAAGVIEPLEPGGLLLTQLALEHLVEHLPDKAINESLATHFNRTVAEAYDQARDFVLLHYVLSGRDEPFWRDARAVAVPNALSAGLDLYRESGIVSKDLGRLFPEPSFHHVLSGSDCVPRRPLPTAELADLERVWEVMTGIKARNSAWAATLPSHAELMTQVHKLEL
jgi:tryptophan halogenase